MTEHLCEPTPNGWRSGRLKSTVAFSKNGVWGDEPDGVDDIRCVRVADFDRSHQRISHSSPSYRKVSRADRLDRELQVGDLLLEKSGGGEKSPVGFVVLVDRPEPAVCSNFVARLVLQDGMDPRFWTYVHGAMYHLRITQRSIKQSTGIQNLDQGSYLNERVSIPPPAEQRAIADFLDRETAQIDAFIAKNEELFNLLTERTAAVTSELGREHVGTGPRLKHHLREVDVRAGSAWPALPLLSVSIAWGVRRRDEVTEDAPQASDLSGYKVAEIGDIVLNRMRAFQGALGVSPVRGLVSPDYAVFRSRGDLNAHWMAHVMKTPRFVGEMTSRLKGIGGTESGAVRTPRINVADLNEIRVWVPSAALQAAGVDHATASLKSIDGASATAGRAIDLARERRAALISAAVTGKIDVGVSA